MLFYRARLDGPAEVLDVSLSPVRPARPTRTGGAATALGQATGLHGRVRVVLRYGPAAGPLRIHRGWLYTDLPPGRRFRLAGCQVDGGEVLLSLAAVSAGAGREHLRDRFRLPFRLTSWGVEAVTGIRAEVFCIPSVRSGALVLRGRGAVVLETPAARLVRAVPFCRRVAVQLNAHLDWRARAAVEGVEVRVGPGGAVEGWLHVAVDCRGEPGRAHPAPGAAGIVATDRSDQGSPAAVRKVDARVKRLDAEVVSDGLALVSGAVELDVAWADRSGRGRWTSREAPFSALLPMAGLCEGDRLEPVAQVERLVRAGRGADEHVHMLVALGLTGLRAVHLELGGAWYRAERVVGQAVATVELNEPLFPREMPPVVASKATSRKLALETGLNAPWTALAARIRCAGGRAALEARAEPCGDGSAPESVRLDLPGAPGAALSVAVVGKQAVIRAGRHPCDGGVEVALPRGTATAVWHPLPVPARWIVDLETHPGGVACVVRSDAGLRRVALTGSAVPAAAVTVAGTAVPGAGLDRLWMEVLNE